MAEPFSQPLSRREFLKLGSLALAGLFLPPLGLKPQASSDLQGRVLEPTITIYAAPSLSAQAVKQYWRDVILPISEVTIGDGQPDYNRVWYHIGQEGYAHSGGIQPVRIQLNPPSSDIPPDGCLGEITVPYSDARWRPDATEGVAYRLYYETTHWVVSSKRDAQGNDWYGILDDKWKYVYYVTAAHLRLVPPEEIQPLSPEVPLEGKRIEVLLEQQSVIAYEWDQPVWMSRAATGARFSNGNYETPSGRHICNWKRPYRHMAAGDRAAPNSYDLPGVPWVVYFTEDGISFHGTYWHNDFGKPRSHGCVNLPIQAARWLYRWTIPSVPAGEKFVFEDFGTRVDIF